MSQTRDAALPVSSGTKQEPGFFEYYTRAIFTGLMVGPISSTLTFPVDKVAFAYQTIPTQTPPTFYQAFRIAFASPFSGYIPGIISASCKNIFMFPAKSFFQYHLDRINPNSLFNNELSGFFAGILTVYATSPMSVIKALRYNNLPISQIQMLNWQDFFRGVHATAYRDGVQLGMFFGTLPMMMNYFSNPFFSGGIAGLMGGICSNPLSVISMNQKIKGSGLFQEAISLYAEGGVRRFYRGFFRTTALRMGIQGGATAMVIDAAEKFYHHLTIAQEQRKIPKR